MELPAELRRLLSRRIPHGQRDITSWTFAVVVKRHRVPPEISYSLAGVLHQHMEQPPNDYYPVELIYEKLERVNASDHTPLVEREDLSEPPKFIPIPSFLPNTAGMSVGEAALAYTEAGYTVIPIARDSKRPLVRWKEYRSRRPGAEEVRSWWEAWPDANIGLLTGAVNDLTVMDFDDRADFDEHPLKEFWLRDTQVVETGRGVHVYFHTPSPVASRNFRGRGTINVKGEGGYVVAPPSVHSSGKVYRAIDNSRGYILSFAAGAPRYCREAALMAKPSRVPLVDANPYASLPEEVLNATTDAGWRDGVGSCGYWTGHLRDKASHEARYRQRCREKGCPADARGAAWRWLDAHRERIQAWRSCTAILGKFGGVHDRKRSEAVRKRAAAAARKSLRGSGWRGDCFMIPHLASGPGGRPELVYSPLLVGDGRCTAEARKALADAGAEVLIQSIPKEDVEDFLFRVLWTVHSGKNLWEAPAVFHLWRGTRLPPVTGIDIPVEQREGGKVKRKPRRGFAKGHKLPPRRCPICGEELKVVLKDPHPLTWPQCLKLVEEGKAILVGEDMIVFKPGDGAASRDSPT